MNKENRGRPKLGELNRRKLTAFCLPESTRIVLRNNVNAQTGYKSQADIVIEAVRRMFPDTVQTAPSVLGASNPLGINQELFEDMQRKLVAAKSPLVMPGKPPIKKPTAPAFVPKSFFNGEEAQ